MTAKISGNAERPRARAFELPWTPKAKADTTRVDLNQAGGPDQKLLQSIVRAHAWMSALWSGTHDSIESLALAMQLHPKVVRQALRLAFLAPQITESILHGSQPAYLSLAKIPFALPLPWAEQCDALGVTG
ncbi:hypothetical protein [Bradyrhizobium cenepequi]|uniref:hypothetical protein n=1 Tax=Bradyrhizobium cenepequi TaxID=2821403 RepID=UPI001CE32FF4|nr:hypothetical protein [Bradyrhizobium cenepequi]MCA6112520.1 hypothetical protein [Bradyrhizobium cenepequi]